MVFDKSSLRFVPAPPPPSMEEVVEDMRKEITKAGLVQLYWGEKLSVGAIARLAGYSDGHILDKMREYSIKRRTLLEAHRTPEFSALMKAKLKQSKEGGVG